MFSLFSINHHIIPDKNCDFMFLLFGCVGIECDILCLVRIVWYLSLLIRRINSKLKIWKYWNVGNGSICCFYVCIQLYVYIYYIILYTQNCMNLCESIWIWKTRIHSLVEGHCRLIVIVPTHQGWLHLLVQPIQKEWPTTEETRPSMFGEIYI